MVRSLRSWPAPRALTTLALALALGLTLGIRPGGGFVLGYLGVAVLGFCLHHGWQRRDVQATLRVGLQLLLELLLPVTLLAIGIALFFWPWGQQSPLAHLLDAQLRSGRFSDYTETVLLAGRELRALDAPRDYLPRYLGAKLPLLWLLPIAVAPLLGLRQLWRRAWPASTSAWALVVLAGLAPLLAAVLGGAVLYDGIRHVLFVLPLGAVVSAAVIDVLFVRLDRLGRWPGALGRLSLGAALLALVVVVARLHPYAYVYYNPLVGGVQGAVGRYELDYWGQAYREAATLLAEQLAEEQGPGKPPTGYRVASCGPRHSIEPFLKPGLTWTGDAETADFYLAGSRGDCARWSETEKVLVRVERLGVTLCTVLDRRRGAAGAGFEGAP